MAPDLNTAEKTETQRETQWALKQPGVVFLNQYSQASVNICME